MPFDPESINLPIVEILDKVKDQLRKENTLIVHAPPGAGKSTLLPIALKDETWLKGQKIIMLEPRRLAARSIAMRLSELLGEKVGETVGYRIRFENKVGKNTKIQVVTEGILTRMLHGNNSLEGVGLVIFDEFHERNIHSDVALTLCRESQQVLRPDLKIMVMSATLNIPQLTQSLKAPVVESKGRQYPVEIEYAGDQDQFMIPEMTAHIVFEASKAHEEGDILVFMPGQGEIIRCASILKSKISNFLVYPLYGKLPYNKQKVAILPNKEGKRKVVLATNIAETSLTIEGIKIVVDTGFERVMKWDSKLGLSRLETVHISKDSADQRAGRSGRLGPGVCYRMWSKVTNSRLQEHRTPEILKSDLTSLALDITSWGISDPFGLTWVSPPPQSAWQTAIQTLHEVEALENGRITDHGKKIHQLPCHPRLAHMMLMAEEGLLSLATDVAALLEERDPLGKEAGIDINHRIEALRTHRKEDRKGGQFDQIEKVASSYRKLFDVAVDNDDSFDPYETGLLLTHAFPERIAFARPGNNAQFKLANGRIAMAGHKDDLAHESWLTIAHLDARDGIGKIFMASPLNPKDLAPRVKEVEIIEWDTEDGGLNARKDLCIGNIVLKSVPLPNPDPSHLLQAIVDVIKKEGHTLLDWNKEVEQLQHRVYCLKKWLPACDWPDFSTRTLLMTNKEWLAPYFTDVKKPHELKKIDLYKVLLHTMEYDKQQKLQRLAPTKIEVPSGSNIQIMYRDNGEAPVLAVRIQELFGLVETPTVNDGKIPLLIHLLSPSFKPVQVTSDLGNFWNKTYFEVRKDLKGRYPKHYWPDDPRTVEAVRGVKRHQH